MKYSAADFLPLTSGATRTMALLGLVALAPAVRAQGGPSIGTLSVVRQVQVSRGIIAPGASATYQDARNGQSLFAGQGIRTLRRSQAQITFTDKSVLRVGERTDMVVQDTATLRRIQMQTGLVWVRVRKGTQTQVETPSATAVARGTEFTVQYESGTTILSVYEGTVELQGKGDLIRVGVGQRITLRPDGTPTTPAPVKLAPAQIPVEYGGALDGWWDTTGAEAGLATLSGSSVLLNLRTTTIAEAIQQTSGLQGLPQSPDNRGNYTDAERQRLLQIAQATLVPDFRQSGGTLDAYRQTVGGTEILQRFGSLSSDDAAFLARKSITNVGDFLAAVQRNSAGIDIGISTRALHAAAAPLVESSRAYYRPGSITGTPNYDLRLLDPNESNDTVLAIGAAAALLTSALRGNTTLGTPQFEVSGFGLAADTSLGGGRARVSGRVGQTRYRFEGNVVQLFEDVNGDNRTSSRLGSVAVVEQTIAPGVSLFAGRRRFYHGPVFQNQNLSQLIADRYSGAGVTLQRGLFTFDGGWAHDTNPVVKGAQSGALGSVFYKALGGQFGVHYLHVPKLSGVDGTTVSASLPVAPNKLDFYTEIGRGPDRATLQTYGVYFPLLFQSSQTDLFVEYGSHQGVGHSLTITGSRDAGPNLNFRSYVNFDRTDGTKAGLAAIVRLGN